MKFHWYIKALLIAFTLTLATACSFSGGFTGVRCDTDDDCQSGATCMDGYCVLEGEENQTTPDCLVTGEVLCDGRCVDTTSDDEHCGDCGNSCFAGEYCQAGSCQDVAECGAGELACGSLCVDDQTDNDHCGGCGISCSAGQSCQGGNCIDDAQCEAGELACGELCVDDQTDDDHCGGCNITCPSGSSCSEGQCVCSGGQTLCDGQCVDLQSDNNFCGSCQTACGGDDFCYEGQCTLECDETEVDQLICGEQCINPLTNTTHCGDCDQSCPQIQGATTQCVDGGCVQECTEESSGAVLCEAQGLCTILNDDVDHCGDCGRECQNVAGATRHCDDGSCLYECTETGHGYCSPTAAGDDTGDGQCVDLRTVSDCGSCGNICPNDGPTGSVATCTDNACAFECIDTSHTYCAAEDYASLSSDLCVDLQNDVEHCGECGQGCAPVTNGTVTCESGGCQLVCDQGYTDCGGECVDTTSDFYHCGGCNDACVLGELCEGGNCEVEETCDPTPSAQDNHYPFGGGQGTSGDPYRVCSAAQLQAIDDGHLDRYFEQHADIDLTGVSFTPIGRATGGWTDWTGQFEGSYDGNGYQIQNLTISSGGQNRIGLFGVVIGGHLENIHLVDADITGASFTGGLVGINYGNIVDCQITGNDSSVSGADEVGGLVGYSASAGTVSGTQVHATVSGNAQVGGLIGRNDGQILESGAHGDVSGPGGRIGGLVGELDPTGNQCLIIDSHATGTVSASGNSMIGGLVGRSLMGCSISESSATGNVNAPTSSAVGGLVGWVRPTATVTDSHAEGDVTGYNFVGGLIGRVTSIPGEDWSEDPGLFPVVNSHAIGAVTGNSTVGGLVGMTEGTIDSSYATGVVTGASIVGGLVGRIRMTDWGTHGTVVESYATGAATGTNLTGGLVGQNEGHIHRSFASGPASGWSNIGGLAGLLEVNAEIVDSYATGSVTGNNRLGGLVGRVMGPGYTTNDPGLVQRCYSTGLITASTTTEVGGLIGRNRGDVEESYWNTTTSQRANSEGGTGLTAAEFEEISSFFHPNDASKNWDFVDVWELPDDRPLLQWE